MFGRATIRLGIGPHSSFTIVSKQPLRGTTAKGDVCPGSSISTRAKFLVDPVESASMGLFH